MLVSSSIWGSLLDITVWQLRSCFCRAPSLTRGWVCLLYMLLALASVVFVASKSLRTRDHILLSQIWNFSFRRLLRLAGSRWMNCGLSPSPSHIATDGQSVCLSWCRAPAGLSQVQVQVQVQVTLQLTVSQSVSKSWYRAPSWGPWPDIYCS
jgi:hypothetical protein